MKKSKLAAVMGAAVCCLALCTGMAGCSSSTTSYRYTSDLTTINLAVPNDYHEEVAELAADVFESYDITVNIKTYSTAEECLDALNSKEVDAAYCTNAYRLNEYNAENDTDLTDKGSVTYGRMGMYSKTLTSISDLEDGATIAMLKSKQETSRGLQFLATQKLITLASTATPLATTEAAIATNSKNLKFEYVDYDQIISALDKYDAVLIPYDDAIAGGLKFSDALATETSTSGYGGYFSDIVAVANNAESVDKYDKLIKSLSDSDVQDAITALFPSKEVGVAAVAQDFRTDKFAFEQE